MSLLPANKIYAHHVVLKVVKTHFCKQHHRGIFCKNGLDRFCQQCKELLKPRFVNAATGLVLINTIFFNGAWFFKFRESATVNPPKMYEYKRDDQLEAQILFVKFVGHQTGMVTPKAFGGIMEDLETTEMILYLPKSKMEETIGLKEMLMLTLGAVFFEKVSTKFVTNWVGNIFNPGKADFGGITTNSDGLFVGDAAQKSYIVVDEYGCEPGAASGEYQQFRKQSELS